MKYLAMIQARCGSTRLPNKVMKDLCGEPALQRMIERVQRSKKIDEVMVITSIEKENLPLIELCAGLGIRIGVGSEDDVLDRFYMTAKLLKPQYVVRLTGDCPCIDPELIDTAIDQMDDDIDYLSNTLPPTFADGLDFEVLKFSALESAWKQATHTYEREHITQYIIRHPEKFKLKGFLSPIGDFSEHRWTVDEPEDFELVERIFNHFLNEERKLCFNYIDVYEYLQSHPEIMKINQRFMRNEGLQKSIREDTVLTVDMS